MVGQVNLILPEISAPNMTLWNIQEDQEARLARERIAMIHGDLAEAIKYQRQTMHFVTKAKQVNMTAGLDEFAVMVNDTIMTPIFTAAEYGINTVGDVVDLAAGAVGLISHPVGLMATIGATLGALGLIAITFLLFKAGCCKCKCRRNNKTTRDDDDEEEDELAAEIRIVRRETDRKIAAALKKAILHADNVAFKTFDLCQRACGVQPDSNFPVQAIMEAPKDQVPRFAPNVARLPMVAEGRPSAPPVF